ncbi:MAG: hypothetical protein M0Q91_17610 [Methanoregula sp.]|jgi:hypothetical protein|nr:hypothetical protein [Methanoregula sp.]
MSKSKKVFFHKWMNKTKFRNSTGSLDIKRTNAFKDEAEALAKYDQFTNAGYAVQLCSAVVQEVQSIDKKKLTLWLPAQVIKENDRWKIRMHKNKIEQTKNEIAGLQKRIQNALERITKLEETDPLEQQQEDLPETRDSL